MHVSSSNAQNSFPMLPLDDSDDDSRDAGNAARGQRGTGGAGSVGKPGGSNIHETQMAQRRRDAENALLSSIESEVSRTTWSALTKTLRDMRDKSITFDQFSFSTTSILKNHLPRCRELQDMMRPGTDAYVYTPPGNAVLFRPWFHKEDLGLAWDAQGDNFSKTCAICLGPFRDPIRTLDCMHTFCEPCLSQQLLAEEGVDYKTLRNNVKAPIQCSTCRDVSIISSTPTTLAEKAHNSMLLAFQAATLKYKCPFEGCDDAFVSADWDRHVGFCMKRKFICNKGCGEVLHAFSMHWWPQDCIGFLKDKREQQTKEIMAFKDKVAGLDRELKRTRERSPSPSSGMVGGGGTRSTRVRNV